MKYYLVKITREESQDTQTIFAYDSQNKALIAFHQEMAGAMAYETVLSCMCMVIDERGVTLAQERYLKAAPNEN